MLGSGIYVLIGAVAGEVGGAFWAAFAVGVTVAAFTGLAYAELATKYPQAAGASLYVNKAFKNTGLTFMATVLYLSATFAAAGSLAAGFAKYFGELWELPPTLLVMIVFILLLAFINYIGITESVVVNMVMTIVEVTGLVIVLIAGAIYIGEGKADFSTLTDFSSGDNIIFAIIAGVALAFFAMTGFENAANVAEETINPQKALPRALIGGMVAAGVIYVLVSIAAGADGACRHAGQLRRRTARGDPGRDPADLGVGDGDCLRRHRDDRDHQHHSGPGGHPVPDPLRDGP